MLVGDRVPEDDPHWLLLLLLVEVVDYIMAPRVTKKAIFYLEMNLNILFKEFKSLFPNHRITPKCHYVLHYPRLIVQVGPLIRHWVMRFEAKHHFFKRSAVVTGNYTNVAKTLALRHQIEQTVILQQSSIINPDVVINKGFQLDLIHLPMGAKLAELLQESKALSCGSVLIFSTKYRLGDSLLFGYDEAGIVQIGKISHILVNTSKSVCFLLCMYDIIEYCEHFHSWKFAINDDAIVKPVLFESLPDHQIIGIHKPFGSDEFFYANFRYQCFM